MVDFILLLIVPLIVALVTLRFFKGKVTIGEFLLQVATAMLVAGLFIGSLTYTKMSATEVWNSQITSRDQIRVSCSYSNPCDCRAIASGSGNSHTTSTLCSTCYEHPYDVDWSVTTSSGESLNINRVDSQGLIMLPRSSAWHLTFAVCNGWIFPSEDPHPAGASCVHDAPARSEPLATGCTAPNPDRHRSDGVCRTGRNDRIES